MIAWNHRQTLTPPLIEITLNEYILNLIKKWIIKIFILINLTNQKLFLANIIMNVVETLKFSLTILCFAPSF